MNGPKSFTIGPHFTRVMTAINARVKWGVKRHKYMHALSAHC